MPDLASPNQPQSPAADKPVAKHPLTSRTLLGIALALSPLLARWLGLELDDAEVQATAEDLVTLLGGALAIYGRFAAKQRLSTSAEDLAK